MALSQCSMWKVFAILPSRMVWISMAMIRKLLPLCGTPNKSPAGVPVTSPRYAVARDQHFLDVEFHVRNRVGEIRDHLDRGVAAPAFARQIAGAGFVILRQDLFLNGFDVAAAGDIEQAVPGCDDGAGCWLG